MDKIRLLILAVAVLLLPATDAAAAPRRRSRGIGKEFSFPAAGIKIRAPAGAASQLLPSPTVYATKKSDGTALYRSSDLWRHLQTVAVWNGQGFSAELAQVMYPPLPGKEKLFSIADAKTTWRAYSAVPGDAELLRWAKSFFNTDAGRMTEIGGQGDFKWKRLENRDGRSALFFGSGGDARNLQMFVFCIRWQGGDGGEKEWRRLAERCAVSAKKLEVRNSGTGTARSGTYAERLEQAQKSISGLRNWYIRETTNYIFVTNQRSRGDMRRLQTDLELAREIFQSYFPFPGGRSGVGVVKLFAERGEYLHYVGDNLKWTAGVWMPAVRELVVSPLGVKADDKIVAQYMRNVALHEGFHQYIFYACNEVNPALWINEGCAQFFETSLPRQGEVGVLDKPTEAKLVRAAASGNDLARFVSLDHKGFYADDEREHNYALAHALCYYLLRGAPALGEEKFSAIPGRYMSELRRTRDLDKAREHAFEGIDFALLEQKHKEFWRSKKLIMRAKHYRRPIGR